MLALGLLCTALAYVLYFRLISSVGPTKTGTVTYVVPLFGIAWGTLFLGEPVTGGMFAGLALILASMLLVNEVKLGRLATFGRRAARYAVLHQRAVLEPAGRECTTC